MSARFPRIIPGSACFYNGFTVAKPHTTMGMSCFVGDRVGSFCAPRYGKSGPGASNPCEGPQAFAISENPGGYIEVRKLGFCRLPKKSGSTRIRRRKGLVFDAYPRSSAFIRGHSSYANVGPQKAKPPRGNRGGLALENAAPPRRKPELPPGRRPTARTGTVATSTSAAGSACRCSGPVRCWSAAARHSAKRANCTTD